MPRDERTGLVRVHGHVYGHPRMGPVVGAKISVNGKAAHTNHEGVFTVYVPQGEHVFVVEAPGYEKREMTVTAIVHMQVDFLLRLER